MDTLETLLDQINNDGQVQPTNTANPSDKTMDTSKQTEKDKLDTTKESNIDTPKDEDGKPEDDLETNKGEDTPDTKTNGSDANDASNDSNDGSDKFKKQSSSFQQKLTEKHERLLKTEMALIGVNPERLIALAESEDDSDINMAKIIAKKLFNTSLKDAVTGLKTATISKNKNLNEQELRQSIQEEERIKVRREYQQTDLKADFIKSNDIVNPESEQYDQSMAENFEKRIKQLAENDILSNSEWKELLEDAYFLATKNKQADLIADKVKKDMAIKQAQTGIAGAGSNTITKQGESKPTDDLEQLLDKINYNGK